MNRIIMPLSLMGVRRSTISFQRQRFIYYHYRQLSTTTNINPINDHITSTHIVAKPTINTIVDKYLCSTMMTGLVSASLLTTYGYDQLGFAIMLSSLWGGLLFQYRSKN